MSNQRDAQAGQFDPARVSQQIESCRANAASLSGLAHITSQALHGIEYEAGEPHLGACMHTALELLDQVHAALPSVGVVLHGVNPQTRAMEIAVGCEARPWAFNHARHITLATIYILESSDIERGDEINDSLRNLERGMRMVVVSVLVAVPAEK